MQNQLVFQEKTEMERLRVQNELLECYETPVFNQIFSERQNLAVLDIGCNDGMRFYLRPLKKEEIEGASLLSDECVRKNLYPTEEIAATLNDQEGISGK